MWLLLLLLLLLVPAVHRPLWEAVQVLQQAVLASGPRVRAGRPQSKVRAAACVYTRARSMAMPWLWLKSCGAGSKVAFCKSPWGKVC